MSDSLIIKRRAPASCIYSSSFPNHCEGCQETLRPQLLSHSHNCGSYHKRKGKYIFHFCQDVGSVLQPSTNLFDRSSAFRLSPSFLRCVNSSDIPCQAVALCFSSCTVKASITALFPSQAPLQLSLSTAALQGQGSRKQQPSASQAQPCQLLPALQDSYNILFKGDLFPF